MKQMSLMLALTLVMTVIAVMVASYNLVVLYGHEKDETMATVKKCAENAFVLEMIGRMERSEKASQSFIRLNSLIESAQQKDGRPAAADTIMTSLMSILRIGLEFQDNNWRPNQSNLDSIFYAELHRNGLFPRTALILENVSNTSEFNGLWTTDYRISPSSQADYCIFISPMQGNVLSHMWGIIIPFAIVVLLFIFLSVYLVRSIGKMKTLEEMKDDFTHNMTHELKTPVAVAYSAADSMLRYYDQSDEARNKRFLRIIMQRLGFLSGMIENILSMSMERSKVMKLSMERVTVKHIVKEVAGMMELKADKPVVFDMDIPDTLSIQTDSMHFGNILTNLMENAVKYSGESVSIAIKADSRSMSIADNGIGIDKENLPFIFDKFYRVASGDRYDVGGYGLGLYYVRKVVDAMGWGIDVASKPGQGTKFTICFDGNEKR